MNTFITPTWVTTDVAMNWKNEIRLIREVSRTYGDDWKNKPEGAQIGYTTQVRLVDRPLVVEGQQLQQQAQQAQQEMELRRQTIDITRQKLGQAGLEAVAKKYENNLKMLADSIDNAPDSGRATAILQSLEKLSPILLSTGRRSFTPFSSAFFIMSRAY